MLAFGNMFKEKMGESLTKQEQQETLVILRDIYGTEPIICTKDNLAKQEHHLACKNQMLTLLGYLGAQTGLKIFGLYAARVENLSPNNGITPIVLSIKNKLENSLLHILKNHKNIHPEIVNSMAVDVCEEGSASNFYNAIEKLASTQSLNHAIKDLKIEILNTLISLFINKHEDNLDAFEIHFGNGLFNIAAKDYGLKKNKIDRNVGSVNEYKQQFIEYVQEQFTANLFIENFVTKYPPVYKVLRYSTQEEYKEAMKPIEDLCIFYGFNVDDYMSNLYHPLEEDTSEDDILAKPDILNIKKAALVTEEDLIKPEDQNQNFDLAKTYYKRIPKKELDQLFRTMVVKLFIDLNIIEENSAKFVISGKTYIDNGNMIVQLKNNHEYQILADIDIKRLYNSRLLFDDIKEKLVNQYSLDYLYNLWQENENQFNAQKMQFARILLSKNLDSQKIAAIYGTYLKYLIASKNVNFFQILHNSICHMFSDDNLAKDLINKKTITSIFNLVKKHKFFQNNLKIYLKLAFKANSEKLLHHIFTTTFLCRQIPKGPWLHFAIQSGNPKLFSLLVDNGFNKGLEKDVDGYTCLGLTAKRGDINFMRFLLNKIFIDTNKWINKSHNENNESLLQIAVKNNKPDLVKYLLEVGENVNWRKYENDPTPAIIAAKMKNFAMLKLLVDKGANLKLIAEDGSAIHYAAANDDWEMIKFLLDNDRELLSLRDHQNSTFLFTAAEKGHNQILENLQKLNLLDLNQTCDQYDETLLMAAASNDHHLTIELLSNYGADLNVKNSLGQTAAYYALVNDHVRSLLMLKRLGADLTMQDPTKNLVEFAIDSRLESILDNIDILGIRHQFEKVNEYGFYPIYKLFITGQFRLLKALKNQNIDLTKVHVDNLINGIQLAAFNDYLTILHEHESLGLTSQMMSTINLMQDVSMKPTGADGVQKSLAAEKENNTEILKIQPQLHSAIDEFLPGVEDGDSVILLYLRSHFLGSATFRNVSPKLLDIYIKSNMVNVLTMRNKNGVSPSYFMALYDIHEDFFNLLLEAEARINVNPGQSLYLNNKHIIFNYPEPWFLPYKKLFKALLNYKIDINQIRSPANETIEEFAFANENKLNPCILAAYYSMEQNFPVRKKMLSELFMKHYNNNNNLNCILTAMDIMQIYNNDVELNLNELGINGYNLLAVAILEDRLNFIRYLCSQQIDVNFKSNGMTPAFLAAQSNNVKALEILIENGADLTIQSQLYKTNIMNYENLTPLDIAIEKGYVDIIKLIKNPTIIQKVSDLGLFSINKITLEEKNLRYNTFLNSFGPIEDPRPKFYELYHDDASENSLEGRDDSDSDDLEGGDSEANSDNVSPGHWHGV